MRPRTVPIGEPIKPETFERLLVALERHYPGKARRAVDVCPVAVNKTIDNESDALETIRRCRVGGHPGKDRMKTFMQSGRLALDGVTLVGFESGCGIILKDGVPTDTKLGWFVDGRVIAAPVGPVLVMVLTGAAVATAYRILAAELPGVPETAAPPPPPAAPPLKRAVKKKR